MIGPGWDGAMLTVTLSVLAALVPQELFAVTEMEPLFAPTFVAIDVVVELPLQPEGNVHAYEVAPETDEML